MKIVGLIPIKMNNERTPGKNTKCFDNGYPLIHYIQSTLLNCKDIDEVYVYCSSPEINQFLLPSVRYIERDSKYDSSTADVNDMFCQFSTTVVADIYVLAHATAPFLKSESIECGLNAVIGGRYDSALAVEGLQEFFWKDDKPFNYNIYNIPRTQDLDKMYVETTGLYIFTKSVIQKKKSRIGDKPFLIEVSKTEAVDINNPIDFEIANAMYNGIGEERLFGRTL